MPFKVGLNRENSEKIPEVWSMKIEFILLKYQQEDNRVIDKIE